ncbi:MAG: WecB/TagA/CpsF family glycosyltransferase, partial [Candidatus Margulisbacteria bacterium]|nr:WecB/TagA/CpsF family glycosyltransferase [Candidatus Margulisiibacteriota bacterium]
MTHYLSLLGYQISTMDIQELITHIKGLLHSGQYHVVTTLNPEIMAKAEKDAALKKVIQKSALIVSDGIGLTLAAKWAQKHPASRISGIDLVYRLLKENQFSFYFLGGKKGVADKAKEMVSKQFPQSKVLGVSHGYISEKEMESIIQDISSTKPDIILVG